MELFQSFKEELPEDVRHLGRSTFAKLFFERKILPIAAILSMKTLI